MTFKRRQMATVSSVHVAILTFISSFIFVVGCAAQHDLGSGANTLASLNGTTLTADPTLESQAVSILSTNCASCHGSSGGMGNVSNITDKSSLYLQGLIVPGDATQGLLMSSISSNGNMPLSGSKLSSQDVQTIQNWINSMQLTSAPGSPMPSPSPAPPPLPPLAATYTSISANILQPKCVGCHSANLARSGVRYDNYQVTMQTVQMNSPSNSKLYTICKSGSMPQGGTPLTATELSTISTWISNGAPNN